MVGGIIQQRAGRRDEVYPAPVSSASSAQTEDTPVARQQEEEVPGRGPGAQIREEASAPPPCQLRHSQPLLPGAHHRGAENTPKVKCTVMGAAQTLQERQLLGTLGELPGRGGSWAEVCRGWLGAGQVGGGQPRQKEERLGKPADA